MPSTSDQARENTEGKPPPRSETTKHYKLTGKQRDAESGLDYFGARYYASNVGRWISADWAQKPEAVPYSKLDDPQSLNLYEYVGNNPLSKADADGHCFWDLCVAEGTAVYAAGAAAITAIAATSAYLHSPQGQAAVANLSDKIGSAIGNALHSESAKPAPADAKPQEPTSSSGGETAGQRFKPEDRAEDAGKKCVYCGRQTTEEPGKEKSRETDHGDPRSRGGNAEPENRNPSCRTCNRQKGSKTVQEFKEWQKRNPDKVPKAFLIFPHWIDEEEWLPVAA